MAAEDKYDLVRPEPLTVAPDVPTVKHRYIIEHLTELRAPASDLLGRAAGVGGSNVLAWRQVADVEMEATWSREVLMKYATDNEDAAGGWYRVIEPKGMFGGDTYFVEPVRSLKIERADYYERDEAA